MVIMEIVAGSLPMHGQLFSDLRGGESGEVAVCIGAVSYTHLDVYKRQF